MTERKNNKRLRISVTDIENENLKEKLKKRNSKKIYTVIIFNWYHFKSVHTITICFNQYID